jgi:hypothetical protein
MKFLPLNYCRSVLSLNYQLAETNLPPTYSAGTIETSADISAAPLALTGFSRSIYHTPQSCLYLYFHPVLLSLPRARAISRGRYSRADDRGRAAYLLLHKKPHVIRARKIPAGIMERGASMPVSLYPTSEY